MSTPLYFSAKSIGKSTRGDRKPQTLLQAARHNLRELQAESGGRGHICMELSHLNQNLYGYADASDLVAHAKELKNVYKVPKRKLRKDHVQALEFLISVRADTVIDEMAYFKASKNWLIEVFGPEMLLSAVVHFDESNPHMHALVLPIVDDQYVGGAPINKTNLPKLTRQFADQVGKPFGLSFEPKKKLSIAQRDAASDVVIDHLIEHSDPAVSSQIWAGVVEHIKRTPQEFLKLLKLKMPDVPRSRIKTSTQIFTSPGKRTSEDRDRHSKHVPSCVGQRNLSTPFTAQEPDHEAA